MAGEVVQVIRDGDINKFQYTEREEKREIDNKQEEAGYITLNLILLNKRLLNTLLSHYN